MISTVVGSYPPLKQNPSNLKNKILNMMGLYDCYKIAIEHVVTKQITAGIDIISDGQVRDNMVKITANKIFGYEFEGNISKINSKLRSKSSVPDTGDLKYAINVMNRKFDELNLSKKERKKKGIKGLITGPNTMIHSSTIENKVYKRKEDAILDLSEVLIAEARSLEIEGVKMIQIDEPFLSTGLVDMEIAKESINLISKSVNVPLALHCCGDISNVLKNLIDFNVDILDFEFAGSKNNLNVIKDYSDDLNKIGLGCIDTKNQKVESINEITTIIEEGINILGSENLYIDPDCGMRILPDEIAFSKLKNMVDAMKSIKS
ncbi:MAG: methionine synthase [Methanobrevibacter sp.]|jgi:5-methyltetrahydropteroyltriglutamate--homocysteine methyltransferase|nr:methionine synthase [Methanobrevibacter sp.]